MNGHQMPKDTGKGQYRWFEGHMIRGRRKGLRHSSVVNGGKHFDLSGQSYSKRRRDKMLFSQKAWIPSQRKSTRKEHKVFGKVIYEGTKTSLTRKQV